MLNIRTRPDIALLVLRLAAGFSFFMHGYQKVFGEAGIAGVTQGFTQMGIPLPGLAAPFISFLELLGGIALIVGLFTRVFGFLLFCDMAVATLLVHFKNGWLGQGGMELTVLLAAMTLAVALAGAGPYSADAAMDKRRAP
jgi:putative oxidoreductase